MIGKKISIEGASITSVVTCTPPRAVPNDYFESLFTTDEIKSIAKMSGVKTRYWVDEESTVDLCVKAGEETLALNGWDADSIDVFVFVTQTPNYLLPASSIEIQGRLGSSVPAITIDINHGCSGYPYGIFLAMSLLSKSDRMRRALVFVGETTSKIVDKTDRATALLFGDAGSCTAIETNGAGFTDFLIGSDPKGLDKIIVPKSRFTNRFDDMKCHNPEMVHMDGSAVFSFTLTNIPKIIDSIATNGMDIDYYLLHQANEFMLKNIATKAKLSLDKMPINISKFGNTSSASIPLLITNDLPKCQDIVNGNVAMIGFGVGFSWASCCAKLEGVKVKHISTGIVNV